MRAEHRPEGPFEGDQRPGFGVEADKSGAPRLGVQHRDRLGRGSRARPCGGVELGVGADAPGVPGSSTTIASWPARAHQSMAERRRLAGSTALSSSTVAPSGNVAARCSSLDDDDDLVELDRSAANAAAAVRSPWPAAALRRAVAPSRRRAAGGSSKTTAATVIGADYRGGGFGLVVGHEQLLCFGAVSATSSRPAGVPGRTASAPPLPGVHRGAGSCRSASRSAIFGLLGPTLGAVAGVDRRRGGHQRRSAGRGIEDRLLDHRGRVPPAGRGRRLPLARGTLCGARVRDRGHPTGRITALEHAATTERGDIRRATVADYVGAGSAARSDCCSTARRTTRGSRRPTCGPRPTTWSPRSHCSASNEVVLRSTLQTEQMEAAAMGRSLQATAAARSSALGTLGERADAARLGERLGSAGSFSPRRRPRAPRRRVRARGRGGPDRGGGRRTADTRRRDLRGARPDRRRRRCRRTFAAIRNCESDGDYGLNSGNGYYGAYQFSASTWSGLGEPGLASQAPPSVQDAAAYRLYEVSRWASWPTSAAIAGLG